MARLPPLDYLRTFECVARHQSFTLAAKELNRTQASVSQHIRALETFLGSPLFHRLRRGVALTEIGTAYLPSVRSAIDELGIATSTLFTAKIGKKLTLSAPVALQTSLLIPRVQAFARRHPEISFNFVSTIWPDPSFDETVVYGQYGHGRWEGMHAEQITWCRLEVVCRPDFTVNGVPLTEVDQLLDANLISVTGFPNSWPRWFEGTGLAGREPRRLVSTDNSVTALEMALRGYGVALTLDIYTAPYLSAGTLHKPFEHRITAGANHYLLLPSKLFRRDPFYRDFVEFIAKRPDNNGDGSNVQDDRHDGGGTGR